MVLDYDKFSRTEFVADVSMPLEHLDIGGEEETRSLCVVADDQVSYMMTKSFSHTSYELLDGKNDLFRPLQVHLFYAQLPVCHYKLSEIQRLGGGEAKCFKIIYCV